MSSINRPHTVLGDITPVGSVSVIGALHGLKYNLPGFTAAIRYYSDEDGTLATPSGGTVTVSVTSTASNQDTAITGGQLTSTDVTAYVDWRHYCTKLTATPAAVTGATHYQLVVVQEY